MKIFTIIITFFFVSFLQPLTVQAGPEENEDRTLYIQAKSLPAIKDVLSQLIVPSSIEGMEGIKIHPHHKTMKVIRYGKDPVEIEKIFQPVFR